jgi:anti-anti-sigma regulatory factor
MIERSDKLPATARIVQKLTVPEFDLERVELLLPELLKWTAIVTAVALVGTAAAVTFFSSPNWQGIIFGLLLLAAVWGGYKLNERRLVTEAVNLLLIGVTLYISWMMSLDLVASGYGAMIYILPVAAAALLLTPAAGWVWAVIGMLVILIRAIVIGSSPDMVVSFVGVVVGVALLCSLTWLISFLSHSLQLSRIVLRQQISLGQTGVEIGHMVTSALDTSVVTRQAVQMIRDAFDYYHVGLYTLDAENGSAVLKDAAGEAASELVGGGFRVPLDSSKVLAYAISHKQRRALFAWDEAKDSSGRRVVFTHKRFPTRAELVIPLHVGDQIYGALDIHSLQLEAFSEGDVHILEGIGGNIANALEGALLFEERKRTAERLEVAYAEVEKRVEERTAELQHEIAERERLQQEVIDAQQRAIQELTTPIIPVMERIIIVPLIGSIDSARARDMMRMLLEGIKRHRAKIVILDITGVPLVDSGVADHLNKTIQAARLRGAHTIVSGISDAVAETIVDLGLDWNSIETVANLQKGLRAAEAALERFVVG